MSNVTTQFKKGITPWNKGIKSPYMVWNKGKKLSLEHIENLKISHIGQVGANLGKKFPFKERPKAKGRKVWNKGKKMPMITGDKCHLWKGGITPENERIRHSLEMVLWRKSCFERDNFTCQKYGVRTGGLVVHHINNFSEFPELRTSIENGITLSEKAHKEFHQIYGFRNNSRQQLEEFLTKKI